MPSSLPQSQPSRCCEMQRPTSLVEKQLASFLWTRVTHRLLPPSATTFLNFWLVATSSLHLAIGLVLCGDCLPTDISKEKPSYLDSIFASSSPSIVPPTMTTTIDANAAAAAVTSTKRPEAATTSQDDLHALDDLFESEIARMSQDTDAILDSIRRAAQPTPTVRRKTRALLLAQKSNNHNKTSEGTAFFQQPGANMNGHSDHDHHHHDHELDTDDEDDHHEIDDDDMTDDGSVPEEVRRQLQDELTQLDSKFSTDPDGFSEEIRRVSMESLSPLAAMHADEEQILKKDGYPETVEFSPLVGSTFQLIVQAIVVWFLIFAILIRVWNKGLLDDNGLFAWPFALATGTTAQ